MRGMSWSEIALGPLLQGQQVQLAERAATGGRIVFHFAGQGSQRLSRRAIELFAKAFRK